MPNHLDLGLHRKIYFVITILLIASACSEYETEKVSKEISQDQIRQYLLEHPEFVLDDPEIANSISRARSKREGEIESLERKLLLDEYSDLLNSSLSPTSGHKDSIVTLIEFYDYQCSPCKANYQEVEKMRALEKDVRIIYGQLPVFGSQSIIAARAAIAANKQGLFNLYHSLLMTSNKPINIDLIFDIATEVGLNLERLQADMRDPEVLEYLEKIRFLAQALDVTGTPTYIIGDSILRGGTKYEDLEAVIQYQRTHSGIIR